MGAAYDGGAASAGGQQGHVICCSGRQVRSSTIVGYS